MLEYDIPVKGPADVLVASYGPRAIEFCGTVPSAVDEATANVVSAEPSKATFWGVYWHRWNGEAAFLCDCSSEDSARLVALRYADCPSAETVGFLLLGAQGYTGRAKRHDVGLDLAEEITPWAAVVETLTSDMSFDACVAYEVTAPFGAYLAEHLRTPGANALDHLAFLRDLALKAGMTPDE